MVHTYPGLPPIRWVKARQAEKITEDDAEMPEDRQEDSSNWKLYKVLDVSRLIIWLTLLSLSIS